MDSFLPPDVQLGLDNARARAIKSSGRLCVHMGDAVIRISQTWENGFALPKELDPVLRGSVNVYDGPKHLYQCLIVAAEVDGDDVRYEFKRTTNVTQQPPADFILTEDAPIALLT